MPAAKKPIKSDSTKAEKAYAKGDKTMKKSHDSYFARLDSADSLNQKATDVRGRAAYDRVVNVKTGAKQDSLKKIINADSVKRGLKKLR